MKGFFNLHLRNEIIAWFLLLALLPILLITTLNYFYQKERFETQQKQHLSLVLEQVVNNLDLSIEHLSMEIRLLSNTPIIRKAFTDFQHHFNHADFSDSENEYSRFFRSIVIENNFYDLFLISTEGDILFSVKREADLYTNLKSGRFSATNLAQVFESSQAFLDIAFSDFNYYAPSNSMAAFAAIPIYQNQKILGVLAVQIDKGRLDRIFKGHYGLGETGEFVAARIDENGHVVPTIPLKNDENLTNVFENNPNLPIQKAVSGQRSQGVTIDYRGKEVIAAWGYFPVFRWGVVAKTDVDETYIPIYELRFYSIILMFFVSLGIILAVISVTLRVVKPIEHLSLGVQRFARDSLNSHIHVGVENEVGQLAKQFNNMANSLIHSQETVKKYAEELEDKVAQRTEELKKISHELEIANREMRDFMRLSDEYILSTTTDLSGHIIRVSQAFANASGYRKEEIIGRNHNILRHPDMPSELFKTIWQTISKGTLWQGEIKNLRKDGRSFWVKSSIFPIFNEQGQIKEFTSIQQDISDRKKVEALSFKDHLTQVANRHQIETVFESEIERSERYGRQFSVVLLDIDHFKSINDRYGHNVGDKVLQEIAALLKQSTRNTDTVGRWGGEEFILLLPETPLHEAYNMAEKLRLEIEKSTFNNQLPLTSSFGVAQYRTNDTQDSIIKRADDALYESKNQGRNLVYLELE